MMNNIIDNNIINKSQWICLYCHECNNSEDINCTKCYLYNDSLALKSDHYNKDKKIKNYIKRKNNMTLDIWFKVISYLRDDDKEILYRIPYLNQLNKFKYY